MDLARTTLNDLESALYETGAKLVSGELFEAETVERVMMDSLFNVRTKLLIIPTRCARICIGRADVEEIADSLKEAINEAIIELIPFRKDDFLSRDVDYLPAAPEKEEEVGSG
jgi:hypothetical protein